MSGRVSAVPEREPCAFVRGEHALSSNKSMHTNKIIRHMFRLKWSCAWILKPYGGVWTLVLSTLQCGFSGKECADCCWSGKRAGRQGAQTSVHPVSRYASCARCVEQGWIHVLLILTPLFKFRCRMMPDCGMFFTFIADKFVRYSHVVAVFVML